MYLRHRFLSRYILSLVMYMSYIDNDGYLKWFYNYLDYRIDLMYISYVLDNTAILLLNLLALTVGYGST